MDHNHLENCNQAPPTPLPTISGFTCFEEENSDANPQTPKIQLDSKSTMDDVDRKRSSISGLSQKKDVSKRRTRNFEDQFAYKDNWESNTADEIRKDSPVLLELRTNVIVHDEYALVTELSKLAAKRYQREEVNLMISVFHSTCLMFGGSFEPAYFLTVSAIEQHCQTATNNRNAALMQSFLSEILQVPLHRGLVRFNAIPEDCYATGGRTVAAEVEQADADIGIRRTPTQYKRNSMRLQSIASIMKAEMSFKDKRRSLMSGKQDYKEELVKPVDKRLARMSMGPLSRLKHEKDPSRAYSQPLKTGVSEIKETEIRAASTPDAAAELAAKIQPASQANTLKRMESQSPGRHPSSASSVCSKHGGLHGHPLPLSTNVSTHSIPPLAPTSSNVDPLTKPDAASDFKVTPPPIPGDKPILTSKIAKRKSFMARLRETVKSTS